jgi:hypothetical protein
VKKHVNFVGLFNGNLIFQDGYWDSVPHYLHLWGLVLSAL